MPRTQRGLPNHLTTEAQALCTSAPLISSEPFPSSETDLLIYFLYIPHLECTFHQTFVWFPNLFPAGST